jgi:hypothetical protein
VAEDAETQTMEMLMVSRTSQKIFSSAGSEGILGFGNGSMKRPATCTVYYVLKLQVRRLSISN